MFPLSPHFAVFDDGQGRPWALLRPLIERYRAQGWSWLYVADDAALAQAQAALAGPAAQAPGGAVFAASALGFHATPFKVSGIVAQLLGLIREARAAGAAGVLLLIEMGWTVRTPAGAIYHREYEAAVQELVEQLPVAAVCLHPRHLMLGGQLLSALHLHPQVLTPSGEARPNPHHVPPRLLVRQDDRAHFQHWLEELDPVFQEAVWASAAGEAPVQYTLDALPPLITVGDSGGKWKIRTFGDLRIYREDGTPLNWKVAGGATRKLKTLFALLLFRAEEGATPEELIDALWPDLTDPEPGLNRLYQSVTSLRRVLTQPGGEGRQFLRAGGGRYRLAVPEHTWLDVPMFQELCFQGAALDRAADAPEAITAYESAARLYTGDFLADLPLEGAGNATLEWCWNRRSWFRDMHLKVVTRLARLYRLGGRLPEAQAACDTALRVDPTYEAAQEEKLLAFAAAARPDAVRRQYGLYAASLRRAGLGEPSAGLRQLYAELLDQASAHASPVP
ncbi:AfsR/SARP family transcriptional regulator [Deinococcus reticulitermitis]|nr:MEDS domain-containing protein [Deinococcus reticulitermitis]